MYFSIFSRLSENAGHIKIGRTVKTFQYSANNNLNIEIQCT